MVVDYLRSCYSTQVVFTEGQPAVWIDWYFVDESTPVLPYYTVFASGNWAEIKFANAWSGPGEVSPLPQNRPWRYGGRVGDADGRHGPCGTAEQWAGAISWPWPPQIIDPAGTPRCCQQRPNYSWGPTLPLRFGLQSAFHYGHRPRAELPVRVGLSARLVQGRHTTPELPLVASLNAGLVQARDTTPELPLVASLNAAFEQAHALGPELPLKFTLEADQVEGRSLPDTTPAKIGLGATMQAVETFTPPGGCGSLPHFLQVVFSVPGCAPVDGLTVVLGWTGTQWQGTPSSGPYLSISLLCDPVNGWTLNGLEVGPGNFTFCFPSGTDGAHPNLTGSGFLPAFPPCPGAAFTVTITRA